MTSAVAATEEPWRRCGRDGPRQPSRKDDAPVYIFARRMIRVSAAPVIAATRQQIFCRAFEHVFMSIDE
jgi:hypothetical protein